MAASLYDELGVDPHADEVEVRRAYLELARANHPDRLTGATADARRAASQRMARINAAWSVLGDPRRRAAYDAETAGGIGPADSRVRASEHDFVPYDDGPDWIDPRLLDDTSTTEPVHRAATFAPVVLFVSGLAAFVVGFAIGMVELLAVAVVCFVLAGVAFLVVPLLALAKSSQADRQR